VAIKEEGKSMPQVGDDVEVTFTVQGKYDFGTFSGLVASVRGADVEVEIGGGSAGYATVPSSRLKPGKGAKWELTMQVA
jgi:hypothetical protein